MLGNSTGTRAVGQDEPWNGMAVKRRHRGSVGCNQGSRALSQGSSREAQLLWERRRWWHRELGLAAGGYGGSGGGGGEGRLLEL